MRQKTSSGIFVFLILIMVIMSGCGKVKIPSSPNYQFDIYYSYDFQEKNILDTKNNLYIKDMVCNPPKQYDFQLTDAEKIKIYDSIKQNDLFNIKDDFTKNCNLKGCQMVTPLLTATLKITVDDKIKTIKWSLNYIDREDPELKRFQNVVNTIRSVISQKEKEVNIEQPKCGYV